MTYEETLMIEVANRYNGHSKGDPAIKMLVDVYNTLDPLPRGYRAKYGDSYCAIFVTAIARVLQYSERFPSECGAYEMLKKCQDLGIVTSSPEAGGLIFFRYASGYHVGLIMDVTTTGQILTIEGNVYDGHVAQKTHMVTDPDVLAFALPKYGVTDDQTFPFTGTIQTAVNVRSTPENRGSLNRVGILHKGDPVTVTGDDGRWWMIAWKDGDAYIVKSDGRIDIVKEN